MTEARDKWLKSHTKLVNALHSREMEERDAYDAWHRAWFRAYLEDVTPRTRSRRRQIEAEALADLEVAQSRLREAWDKLHKSNKREPAA